VIVDPVNPFSLKGRVVLKPGKAKSIARSLTRHFTYAVCCQELPPGSRVVYARAVLGWTLSPAYRPLAMSVWEVFGIPLAKLRVVRLEDGRLLLSEIAPLWFEDLNRKELRHIGEQVTWVS
jgi:hypothetical protein